MNLIIFIFYYINDSFCNYNFCDSYVIPEDIRYIGKDVLRHRMLLSYEAEAEELTSEELIDQLFKEIPVP